MDRFFDMVGEFIFTTMNDVIDPVIVHLGDVWGPVLISFIFLKFFMMGMVFLLAPSRTGKKA